MAITVFYNDGVLTYFSPTRRASGIPVITQITPRQYLEYARADFPAGDERGLINAQGNIKRALHLMIDTVLQNYGLLAQNKRISFP
jgi:hypothetical protein